MGMKNPDTDKLVMLTNHGQYGADILNIPQMHGVIDTVFNGMQKEFGTFASSVDKLRLLMTHIEKGIEKDAAHQKGYRSKDDSGCQAFKHVI